MTPIATTTRFAEKHKKYVYATSAEILYKSLPQGFCDPGSKPFAYTRSDSASDFYILQYYHRGGDGRVPLRCSLKGELFVLKILLEKENEEALLNEEAKLWNSF